MVCVCVCTYVRTYMSLGGSDGNGCIVPTSFTFMPSNPVLPSTYVWYVYC